MKVAILAGGLGTRMREETEFRPKPMVMVGNRPILWHIMRNYAHFNHTDFVICTGYRGDVIREYFRDFESLNLDFTVKIGQQDSLQTHGVLEEAGWSVTVADTGSETMTGGRLFKVRNYIGKETFMCTYGDGVSDIDISELLKFHKSHGKIATMTAVKPTSRFGVLDLKQDGQVDHFREKPQADGWINAGFFIFEPEVFNYLDSDSILENAPMSNLAKDGQLVAFKHEDFWQAMDTYRESLILNQLWAEGKAPWKLW